MNVDLKFVNNCNIIINDTIIDCHRKSNISIDFPVYSIALYRCVTQGEKLREFQTHL